MRSRPAGSLATERPPAGPANSLPPLRVVPPADSYAQTAGPDSSDVRPVAAAVAKSATSSPWTCSTVPSEARCERHQVSDGATPACGRRPVFV